MHDSLMRRWILSGGLLWIGWGVVHAAEDRCARLDVSGLMKTPIPIEIVSVSEGGQGSQAEWVGANRDKMITAQFPATTDWQQGSVTFKPAKSGAVVIQLLAPFVRVSEGTKTLKVIFVDYDAIHLDGAAIHNGSFESVDAKGQPNYWSPNDTETSNTPLDETNRGRVMSGEAAEGNKFVRVWHNSRFIQIITVEENTPVTVHFSYRLSP